MKKNFLLLVCIFFFQWEYAQSLSDVDWEKDIDFLAKELPAKHYSLFMVKSEAEFQNGLSGIKTNAKSQSNLKTALQLQQFLSTFGDSHTQLNYPQLLDQTQIIPLNLYAFTDGIFVLATTRSNKEITGLRLLAINDYPIETVMDSLSTLITVDNKAILKTQTLRILPFVQLLDYFGFSQNGKYNLKLKDNKGNTLIHPIHIETLTQNNAEGFKPDSVALCFRNQRRLYVDSYFPEDKLYYLQYNQCWTRELEEEYGNKERAQTFPYFADFEKSVFNTLETQKIDKLVFDLRFNGGGNSQPGTQFAEKLAEKLKKYPNVKVYVVIGRATYSSAILNALDFRRLMNACLIGEETSGKPNHLGEIKNFQLPHSGLQVVYSTKYFKYTDDNANTLRPDIKVETSFSDYQKGIDPVFERIRKER